KRFCLFSFLLSLNSILYTALYSTVFCGQSFIPIMGDEMLSRRSCQQTPFLVRQFSIFIILGFSSQNKNNSPM
ncbi:MAG TPA: hypothetical protein VJP58_09980, partial [Candidatus Nitrosocosmicus sp.]|nr:hypothetical protein [Candidatus Nitrosocosmicus sp.]